MSIYVLQQSRIITKTLHYFRISVKHWAKSLFTLKCNPGEDYVKTIPNVSTFINHFAILKVSSVARKFPCCCSRSVQERGTILPHINFVVVNEDAWNPPIIIRLWERVRLLLRTCLILCVLYTGRLLSYTIYSQKFGECGYQR